MRDFRVTLDMRSDDPLAAATAYIEAGAAIILTHGIGEEGQCTCAKSGCGSPGKHPIAEGFPRGVKSATRNKAKIKRLLKKYPDANVAMCLDDRTVVDIDGPDGEAQIDALGVPATATVKTSRGRHLHFRGELEGGTIKTHQIDVLTGASRYAMLPPSVHESGVQYRWDTKSPNRSAVVPEELTRLRRAVKKRIAFPKGKIQKGERNSSLFKAARALRMRGFSDGATLSAIQVINEHDCVEPLSETELRTLVRSSGNYDDSAELFGVPLQLDPLPIEFLWYPYIPLHAVTIIAGDPGRGKSLLLAMITAVVTTGGKWPLSDERCEASPVLILSAEDNWSRVTLRRLLKAGADVSKIHVMHKFRSLNDDRLEALATYVRTHKPALVIIDTLAAYMGAGRDMHRQNEVGEFIAFLNEIAEETGCAVVALAHLNKQTAEHPLFRIVGSIGFAASIRSASFLGTDPNDRTRPALAHGKANGSELGPTIIFEKVGGGRNDVPVLRAVELSDASIMDVCKIEKAGVGRPRSEADEAKDFILGSLDPVRPRVWSSLVRRADAQSIASEGTLNAVRAELAKNGQIKQVGKGPAAKWVLAEPTDQNDRE